MATISTGGANGADGAGPPARLIDPGRFELLADEVVANTTICRMATDGSKQSATLHRELKATADALAGPEPSPAVRSLANTAALAWLALRWAECHDTLGRDRTFARVELDMKRIDRAHRRYVSALKALEMVRRLQTPTVGEVRARAMLKRQREADVIVAQLTAPLKAISPTEGTTRVDPGPKAG